MRVYTYIYIHIFIAYIFRCCFVKRASWQMTSIDYPVMPCHAMYVHVAYACVHATMIKSITESDRETSRRCSFPRNKTPAVQRKPATTCKRGEGTVD